MFCLYISMSISIMYDSINGTLDHINRSNEEKKTQHNVSIEIKK